MDGVVLHSPSAHAPQITATPGPTHEPMLRESIDRFLSDLRRGAVDFSGLRAVFARYLLSPDPSFEAVWLFSAASYHEAVALNPDGVAAIRDLFHLLVSFSSSAAGPKSIALLAPVFSELHQSLVQANKSSDARIKREIELLVESVISYIGLCCSKASTGSANAMPLHCFSELVQVWVARNAGYTGEKDSFGLFFPLIGSDVVDWFRAGRCEVDYLAGVVIAEAFLMRMCLKVQAGAVSGPELQKEIRVWAVSSVTVFRNCIFFEILLWLLLEPTMPVISILNRNDETIVRDILYDVVILVEYSFLDPGSEVALSYDCMAKLAMTRLVVTQEAQRIARVKGDLGKAISYISAFSTSNLPSLLIKWVQIQVGRQRLSRPSAITPHAVLEWLVNYEKQGTRLFGDSMSKLRAKLLSEESKNSNGIMVGDPNSNKIDADIFFDKAAADHYAVEDHEMESTDGVFLSAARAMSSIPISATGKRKDNGVHDGTQRAIKYRTKDTEDENMLSESEMEVF